MNPLLPIRSCSPIRSRRCSCSPSKQLRSCSPTDPATGALKAGVVSEVLSERIGHADVEFFLQTYAHVLKNDDRDAAEQAASFLIGDDWASGSKTMTFF